MNFWQRFLFNSALSFIRGLERNPLQKPKVRAVLLEIWEAIGQAYADDPDWPHNMGGL